MCKERLKEKERKARDRAKQAKLKQAEKDRKAKAKAAREKRKSLEQKKQEEAARKRAQVTQKGLGDVLKECVQARLRTKTLTGIAGGDLHHIFKNVANFVPQNADGIMRFEMSEAEVADIFGKTKVRAGCFHRGLGKTEWQIQHMSVDYEGTTLRLQWKLSEAANF